MATFTTPFNLFSLDEQSIGDDPIEGGNANEEIRIFQPDRGVDILVKNVNNIQRDSGDFSTGVTLDNDGRRRLGTITLNNRDFWENSNYNENTLSPFLTGLREVVEDQELIVDGNGDEIVTLNNITSFSVDAIPFVINPNTDEIVRVDRYYDREIDSERYNLAVDGKINYYLLPRKSGRTEKGNIDTYSKKSLGYAGAGENRFDNFARGGADAKGYSLFRLDWGDGTPLEHDSKPKVLEGTTLLEHTYKKPGFYTIKGVVMAFNGFNIIGWEKFETNILLNSSDSYDLDLYKNKNFAMIGGISSDSVLVKSTANIIGLDPLTLDDEKASLELIEKLNLFDRLNLFDFLNKINSDVISKFNSEINPYTREIFDTVDGQLIEGLLTGCTNPNASNYNPNVEIDDGSCILPLDFNLTTPHPGLQQDQNHYRITIWFINDLSSAFMYPPSITEDPFTSDVVEEGQGSIIQTVINPEYYAQMNRREAYIAGLGLSSVNDFAWISYPELGTSIAILDTKSNTNTPNSVSFRPNQLMSSQIILIQAEINRQGQLSFEGFDFNLNQLIRFKKDGLPVPADAAVYDFFRIIPLTNNLKVYKTVNQPTPAGVVDGAQTYNPVEGDREIGWFQLVVDDLVASNDMFGTYDLEFNLSESSGDATTEIGGV